MQNIYGDTRVLDSKVRELYKLSEDIMMENAAAALEDVVVSSLEKSLKDCGAVCLARPAVLILAGSGNNGADGYALARRLMRHEYAVTVCAVSEPKSQMCVLQKERASAIGVSFIDISEYDDYIERISIDLKVIVDCIFGSGFHGELPYEAQAVIASANKNCDAVRIACDVPSGLDGLGNVAGGFASDVCFCADKTVTMGALKISLYSDIAKDACGEIVLANLGVSRGNFEYADGTVKCEAQLLEKSDAKLPHRKVQNVNKGSFGHASIVCGTKSGAAVIAASAALRFGAGLVSLVTGSKNFDCATNLPFELMVSPGFPANTTAVALGMGLGSDGKQFIDWLCENPNVPAVLDADICHSPFIKELLEKRKGFVLTPHPKEFAILLEQCGIGVFSVKEVVKRRVELVKAFCNKYPDVVLLLKGANVLIGIKRATQNEVALYINPYGCNALAKGGSGDVLSGLVAALLAQKYEPLQAAVYASLAHTSAAQKALEAVKNDFALTPLDLIQALRSI